MKVRVGFGYDVHQLKPGRPCIIGGVEIPSSIGPDGHSDADVLLHAVCDALLGAAGLRDIGHYFPNTSAKFLNADSRELLRQVHSLIREKSYEVGNIDATVVLEKPKIGSYVEQMKKTIAEILSMDTGDISIKATTSETMGFVGREEGVTAYAVALISK